VRPTSSRSGRVSPIRPLWHLSDVLPFISAPLRVAGQLIGCADPIRLTPAGGELYRMWRCPCHVWNSHLGPEYLRGLYSKNID